MKFNGKSLTKSGDQRKSSFETEPSSMKLKSFLLIAVVLAGCSGQSDVTSDTTDEQADNSQVVETGGSQDEVYSEAELKADLECISTIRTEDSVTYTHLFYGGSQSKIYAKVTNEIDDVQTQVTQTVFTNDRVISWSEGNEPVAEVYYPGQELPLAFFPFLARPMTRCSQIILTASHGIMMKASSLILNQQSPLTLKDSLRGEP